MLSTNFLPSLSYSLYRELCDISVKAVSRRLDCCVCVTLTVETGARGEGTAISGLVAWLSYCSEGSLAII